MQLRDYIEDQLLELSLCFLYLLIMVGVKNWLDIVVWMYCTLDANRSDMIIKKIGNSLSHILPELVGQDISRVFDLARPLIEFKYSSVSLIHFITLSLN